MEYSLKITCHWCGTARAAPPHSLAFGRCLKGNQFMDEIHFEGQLNEDDYRAISALASRKLWIFSGLCFIILVVYNLWSGGIQQFHSDIKVIFFTWLPIVIIIPVLFGLQRFFIRRQWRNNKILQQPVKGTISDEGIKWEIDGLSSSQMPWDLLLGYRATSSFLLVYQGLNQVFYFFPRYFSDTNKWEEFRQLVAKKLPTK